MQTGKPSRVLGIVGSPRRGGNTDRLVDDVLRGAKECGASTQKVWLSEFHIEPCQGCLSCYPEGRTTCARHVDDMPQLVQAMKRADLWVLGTPVYCYGPTGQFKVFFDRWIHLLPEVYAQTAAAAVIPLHRAALRARPTQEMLKTTCRSFGIEYVGDLVAPELLHVGDLDIHPEYRDMAYELGRAAVTANRSVTPKEGEQT